MVNSTAQNAFMLSVNWLEVRHVGERIVEQTVSINPPYPFGAAVHNVV